MQTPRLVGGRIIDGEATTPHGRRQQQSGATERHHWRQSAAVDNLITIGTTTALRFRHTFAPICLSAYYALIQVEKNQHVPAVGMHVMHCICLVVFFSRARSDTFSLVIRTTSVHFGGFLSSLFLSELSNCSMCLRPDFLTVN